MIMMMRMIATMRTIEVLTFYSCVFVQSLIAGENAMLMLTMKLNLGRLHQMREQYQ